MEKISHASEQPIYTNVQMMQRFLGNEVNN